MSKKDQEESDIKSHLKALRELEPVCFNLEGSKHLASLLAKVHERFLGRPLNALLDVQWNCSADLLIISSSLGRQSEERLSNLLLNGGGKALQEWVQRTSKQDDLRVFLSMTEENLKLHAEIEEVRQKLNSRSEKQYDGCFPPNMMMLHPMFRRW
jgi:hypothetical protein